MDDLFILVPATLSLTLLLWKQL